MLRCATLLTVTFKPHNVRLAELRAARSAVDAAEAEFERKLAEAMRCDKTNYYETVNVTAVAAAAGISRSQIYRRMGTPHRHDRGRCSGTRPTE